MAHLDRSEDFTEHLNGKWEEGCRIMWALQSKRVKVGRAIHSLGSVIFKSYLFRYLLKKPI